MILIKFFSMFLWVSISWPVIASPSQQSTTSLRDSLKQFLEDEVDLFNQTFEEFKLNLVDFHFDQSYEKFSEDDLNFKSDYFRVDKDLTKIVAKNFSGQHSVKIYLESKNAGSLSTLIHVLCELKLKEKKMLASKTLENGDLVHEGDYSLEWVEIMPYSGAIISDAQKILNKKVTRKIAKGSFFKESYLKDYFAINRGQVVSLIMNKGDLTITEKVKTMESGRVGQKIKVISPHSKKIMEATIENESQVSFNL